MEPNHTPFEEQLRRTAFRPPPAALRDSILAKAASEAAQAVVIPKLEKAEAKKRVARGFSLREFMHAWLWPAPAAWAGLVAIWGVTWLVNENAGSSSYPSGENPSPVAESRPVPEPIRLALLEQRRWRAELLGVEALTLPARKPKPDAEPPRPRSAMVSPISYA